MLLSVAAWLLALAWPLVSPSSAGDFSTSPDGPTLLFEGSPVVAATELEGMRGGYVTPGGIEIAFGIERTTTINGTTDLATSFKISGTTADPGRWSGTIGDSTGSAGPADTLVITNRMDGQRVEVRTQVDIGITARSLSQAQSALRLRDQVGNIGLYGLSR